jgi:flagellar FliL protein
MTGKKILDRILVVFNLLGCLVGIAVYVYTEFLSKRELPIDAVEFAKLLKEGENITQAKLFALDKLTINLYSSRSRLRFLDVEMHLLPFQDRQMALIERSLPIIYDNIIEITGRLDAEELNSVTGKILYEDRIKKITNQIIGKAVIKRIYFTKFVIQ